jgi:hypothetical protein
MTLTLGMAIPKLFTKNLSLSVSNIVFSVFQMSLSEY